MSIKTIMITTLISGSLFFGLTPSTHEVETEMSVRSSSTINQMIVDAARNNNIDVDSVDINESRDLTIHNTGVDAGNLKPGTQLRVTVVYRK